LCLGVWWDAPFATLWQDKECLTSQQSASGADASKVTWICAEGAVDVSQSRKET